MKSLLFKIKTNLFLCLLLPPLLLSGCSIASSGKDKKVLKIAAWQYNDSQIDLDKLTINAVKLYGQDLINALPKDIKDYCPNYKNATNEKKTQFWTALISSLSYFESTHSSTVSYAEKFTNSKGKTVVSRGLLQISLESSNGYQCDVTQENQLHQPRVNLECGVKILSHLVKKDAVISAKKQKLMGKSSWLGAARYWSPFRDDVKNKTMALNTKMQAYCQ